MCICVCVYTCVCVCVCVVVGKTPFLSIYHSATYESGTTFLEIKKEMTSQTGSNSQLYYSKLWHYHVPKEPHAVYECI